MRTTFRSECFRPPHNASMCAFSAELTVVQVGLKDVLIMEGMGGAGGGRNQPVKRGYIRWEKGSARSRFCLKAWKSEDEFLCAAEKCLCSVGKHQSLTPTASAHICKTTFEGWSSVERGSRCPEILLNTNILNWCLTFAPSDPTW